MVFVAVCAGVFPARRRLYHLVLVSVFVALVPLADASPPDPTWLTGVWDAWDFDEVVEAIVSATAVVRSISLLSPKPVDVPAGIVRAADAACVAAAPASRFHTRSPPGDSPW